jgi:hypothetical protein
LLGNGPDSTAIVDRLHPQHGHFRHSAGLVESAAGRAVDQAFIGHVLEHTLEVDLGLPGKTESPRNLALPRRLVGRGDEVEDLLAAGKSGGAIA